MLFKKKVLVTGGGGFLGSAIIKKLTEQHCDIRSISRRVYPQLSSYPVTQIQGDISDKQAVENACSGVDVVFHTAAKAGIWGPYDEYYRTNVIGTANVIESCIIHRVSALIYTSSPSVIFDGSDMEGVDESVPYPAAYPAYYPQTKAIAEKQVIAASQQGLKTIILRPHLIWGPGDPHLTPRIIQKSKKLFIIGDGRNKVDTIYIDNAADAHILAAEQLLRRPDLSGRIYFISQDNPVPLWEMINHILNAAGLPPVRNHMPAAIARIIGRINELVYRLFNIHKEPNMTPFLADELSTSHWFNISAAKKDLGYFPKVSIEEGLIKLKQRLAQRDIT